MARKHYHVIEGLTGGYLPNRNDIYGSKRAALSAARDHYNRFRDQDSYGRMDDDDDSFTWHQTGPGYYEQRNGHEALYVGGPCFDDCESEQDY